MSKSVGADGLHPGFLRELSFVLDRPLFLIFKDPLTTGMVLANWHRENVVQIFKKGSRSESLPSLHYIQPDFNGLQDLKEMI